MAKPGRNRGTKNFRNKLSEREVLTIYKSARKQMVLAVHYGVSQSTIAHIRSGRTWAWLTGHAR